MGKENGLLFSTLGERKTDPRSLLDSGIDSTRFVLDTRIDSTHLRTAIGIDLIHGGFLLGRVGVVQIYTKLLLLRKYWLVLSILGSKFSIKV